MSAADNAAYAERLNRQLAEAKARGEISDYVEPPLSVPLPPHECNCRYCGLAEEDEL